MMSTKEFDIEYNGNTVVNEIKTANSKTAKVTRSKSEIKALITQAGKNDSQIQYSPFEHLYLTLDNRYPDLVLQFTI